MIEFKDNPNNDIKFDDKWIISYMLFLEICKKYPKEMIIPTVKEDFVWHSHLQDHHSYVNDMQNYLGYILDHQTDIDVNKHINKSTEIKCDYYNNKFKNEKTKRNSSCASASCGYNNNISTTLYKIQINISHILLIYINKK